MPKRHISTLSNGNVLVATFDDHGNATAREYTRRGACVYVLQDQGARLPAYLELRPHGVPLLVRRGESLEQTIQRELEAGDQKNSRVLTLYDALFAIGVFSGCVAGLTAIGCLGVIGLMAAAVASDLVAAAGALFWIALAGVGLKVNWSAFPRWHWLLSSVAALTAIGMVGCGVWLGSQPLNLIR